MPTPSGHFWVTWANAHAPNSHSLDDLAEPFRTHAKEFVHALKAAGAHVNVTATLRHPIRAYLFHYSWRVGLGRLSASSVPHREGVDIQWNHGSTAASRAGAMEMVHGFGLAVPPQSTVAPALTSRHIQGRAVDMDITWNGTLHVPKKNGSVAAVPFNSNANANTALHAVGASYGVRKLRTDEPHWSDDGH